MEIKIAENDPQSMSQDGDSILRSLQNKSLSLIDLVVRESIQNALDATIEGKAKTIVNFNIGDFNSDLFANNLEGVASELKRRFNGDASFISISDKNTHGLTGDYLTTDNDTLMQSNFFKLVFGIGKNQEKEGAGGSWGLGKTSYFRIGIGIVFYYIRIKNGDGFEERLIGSLIESPKNKEKILDNSNRGIAWWGEMGGQMIGSKQMLNPITNHQDIEEFLKIFNLQPYEDQETGTTIIIPYLNSSVLRDYEVDLRNDQVGFPWDYKLEEAILTSVGRWYSPRINNKDYNLETRNSVLECKINGQLIDVEHILPAFQTFRMLYTSALLGNSKKESILVKPIFVPRSALKNGKTTPIGHIAFTTVDEKDMKMLPPDYFPSPIECVEGKNDNNGNDGFVSIIAYSRKPGMIVQYSVNGDWFKGQLDEKENTSLLGFFVPNSKGELTKNYVQRGYNTLEQYLRASENADHAEWDDETGFTLIKRIKSYVSTSINETLNSNNQDNSSSVTAGMSKKFGKILLPPVGYGKSAILKSKKSRKKDRQKSGSKTDISVTNVEPSGLGKLNVSFVVTLKPNSKNEISLKLKSQASSPISKSDWEKSMEGNSDFPFSILGVYMDEENNFIEVEENYEQGLFYLISHSDKASIYKGTVEIKINSKDYVPFLAIRQ